MRLISTPDYEKNVESVEYMPQNNTLTFQVTTLSTNQRHSNGVLLW